MTESVICQLFLDVCVYFTTREQQLFGAGSPDQCTHIVHQMPVRALAMP